MIRAKKITIFVIAMLLFPFLFFKAAAGSFEETGFFKNYVYTAPISSSNGGSGHYSASFEMGGMSRGDRLLTDIIAVDVQRVKVEIEWVGTAGTVICDENVQSIKASVLLNGGLWESSYSAVHRAFISKGSISRMESIQVKR